MDSAQFRDRRTGLGLFKYADDLAVCKKQFLHGNLLDQGYEKIPLLGTANLWGGAPRVRIVVALL